MSHRRRTQHARTTTTAPLRMAFDPDVTPGALDAFHAWLTKSGVRLTDNAVLAGRSPLAGGRGLVAAKAIETGQSVLAIPQSLGLTATGLKSSGIAQYVKGFEGWTGETGLIALQVLWERAQGEGSNMAPWIAVLPKAEELEMPLFWGEADLTLADASSTRVRNQQQLGVRSFIAKSFWERIDRSIASLCTLHQKVSCRNSSHFCACFSRRRVHLPRASVAPTPTLVRQRSGACNMLFIRAL